MAPGETRSGDSWRSAGAQQLLGNDDGGGVSRAETDRPNPPGDGPGSAWEWFTTGVRPRPGAGTTAVGTTRRRGRILAFADEALIDVATRHAWIGDDDVVVDRSGPGPAVWRDRPYGLVEDGGAPATRVVLRIGDDHDLSAFLRDADRALATGIFADHLLRPDVLVADLCCLGADFRDGGPDHRIWVDRQGQVSTSPTGAVLGELADSPAVVTSRWWARNDGGTRPCAVGLAGVLDDGDRVEALAERPWLPRFHAAVAAMRQLRARGLDPVAVSGFGRRLDPRVAAVQPGPVIDDATAPLVIVTRRQGRNRQWVLDPQTGSALVIDAADAVRLECLLAFRSRSGAAALGARESGDARAVAAVDRLIAALVDGGVGVGWFAALERGGRPLVPGRSVFG